MTIGSGVEDVVKSYVPLNSMSGAAVCSPRWAGTQTEANPMLVTCKPRKNCECRAECVDSNVYEPEMQWSDPR
jgi:hypothetical protein